jgi:hypothetical protein
MHATKWDRPTRSSSRTQRFSRARVTSLIHFSPIKQSNARVREKKGGYSLTALLKALDEGGEAISRDESSSRD